MAFTGSEWKPAPTESRRWLNLMSLSVFLHMELEEYSHVGWEIIRKCWEIKDTPSFYMCSWKIDIRGNYYYVKPSTIMGMMDAVKTLLHIETYLWADCFKLGEGELLSLFLFIASKSESDLFRWCNDSVYGCRPFKGRVLPPDSLTFWNSLSVQCLINKE